MTIPAGCTPAEPPCCGGFWRTANDLANLVANAIIDCSPPDLCDDLTPWVSHDEPLGLGHYVAVWLMSSRFSRSRIGRQLPQARFGIRYVEPGFPGITTSGGEPKLPTRESLHAASSHSYSHVEAAISALQANAPMIKGCGSFEFEEVKPLRLSANHGGWTITVVVGMT